MINEHDMTAAIIFNTYYCDDTIADFLSIFDADDRPDSDRDAIFTALDIDIADMLHNANLADLLPYAADLSADDHDALSDSLLDDNSYLTPLTDLILAHCRPA